MYRAVMFLLALTFSPAVVAAQEPCTTDAARVVDQLYRHILERVPDAGGARWAQQQLQTGQMTVRDVVAQLAKSEEHSRRFWRQEAGEDAPYSRAVGTLYRHILGRQPDAAGARSWANEGARRGVSTIVDQLVASPEYNKQFGDWGVPGHSGGLAYCAPASRSVSKPQVVPDQRRFAGMDRNGDGIISRAEWRGSNQSFQNQDWNNDGILSGDEVDSGAARFGRTGAGRSTAVDPRETRRAERFDSLDRNGNGRIEAREWDGTVAVFNRLDVNNDNFLSRAEMINAGPGGTAATRGSATSAQVRAERDFNTMDVNTNGRIELREWTGSAAAFDRLDLNNDNVLSRVEMDQ